MAVILMASVNDLLRSPALHVSPVHVTHLLFSVQLCTTRSSQGEQSAILLRQPVAAFVPNLKVPSGHFWQVVSSFVLSLSLPAVK